MGSRGQTSKSGNSYFQISSPSEGIQNVMSKDIIDTVGVKEVKHKALKKVIAKYFSDQDSESWNKIISDIKFWEHPWFSGNYFATYKGRVVNFNMRYGANSTNAFPIYRAFAHNEFKQDSSRELKEIYDGMFSAAIKKKGK